MPDTVRTVDYLLASVFQDSQTAGISAQDMRDLIVSIQALIPTHSSPSYDDDVAAAAGGVGVGKLYRNGNFIMVRLA